MKNIKTILLIIILSLVFFKPGISLAALAVTTGGADIVTDTEATLHGTVSPDLSLNPRLTTTAYFRYSDTEIAPVFCNEIYGNNMVSTKDIKNFNEYGGAQSFSQHITDLEPSTTYHYCSIVSNKKSIVYGEVKSFTTDPCPTCAQTVATTINASNIDTTSTDIRGSYRSVDSVNTYFEYKKDTSFVFNPNAAISEATASVNAQVATLLNTQNNTNPLNMNPVSMNSQLEPSILNTQYNTNTINTVNQGTIGMNSQALSALLNAQNNSYTYGTLSNVNTIGEAHPASPWTRVGDETHAANTFGTMTFPLTGLTPNTKYNYVFKAETADGVQTFDGGILSFKTRATDGGDGLIDTTNCPSGWEGTYPNCVDPNGGGGNICPSGWTGTYPNCVGPNNNNGVCPSGWEGTYPNCVDPNGGGGTGTGTGTTTTTTTTLTIGTIATPPGDATVHYHEGIETVFARQIIADKNLAKLYGYQEGENLTSFAWTLADFFAKVFGYVSASGKEVRVSQPDIAAYQIKVVANKITVYEYYNSRIINIQNLTSGLKNTSGYEYYFKK